MKTLVLKNVILDGAPSDISVKGGVFSAVAPSGTLDADEAVDCSGLTIVPALYNTHTHAAMMPMRGGGDDMPLQKWLSDYIWPYEAEMTAADIRDASKIAIREMTESGSVFFNDMYFDIEQTIDEVDRSGMRACIGITIMENHKKALLESKFQFAKDFRDPSFGRIQLAIAPHSVYTVGPERLKLSAEFAREHGLRLHIHVSETAVEVADCLRDHGMTPVRYLDSLGVLGPNVIAAHCVHLDEEEWDIMAERGVTVSHCPCSNMKLGSGRFPYEMAIKSGARISLGTDSASSNNNLDLREEMKFAALLAKVTGDPELLPAKQVLQWAGENGAAAFGIKGGKICEGYVADALLIDTTDIRFQPQGDFVSNFVYAADSSCIKAVMCNDKIIFERWKKV